VALRRLTLEDLVRYPTLEAHLQKSPPPGLGRKPDRPEGGR
jgi:hypothetical protein